MIKIDSITLGAEDSLLLKDISLEVQQGETVVLFGPSGVGKTVLLKICMGLIEPTTGSVTLQGKEITTMATRELSEFRQRMGMVFQNYALFDSMTVLDNVGFMLLEYSGMGRDEIRERVEKMLEAVNLDRKVADLRPAELSGGMKKRVGIARALIHNPEIVLYDDPTGGLDPVTSDVINDLIISLNQERNVASLAVSNDMNTAPRIGTRMAMLFESQILEMGPPDQIMNSENPWVQQFVEGTEDGPIQYV